MEVSVGVSVGTDAAAAKGLQIRMLGQLTVCRDGRPLVLPASRKVRALLAYLAVSPEGAARPTLCDMLWDVPNDPRGELRWCLSKMRGVLDDQGRARVETSNDRIRLDLSDSFVDVIEIDRILHSGVAALDLDRLREISDWFRGDFLEGLRIEGNPEFNSWLLTQRHRYRAIHLAIVERFASLLLRGSDEHFQQLQSWLQLAPFDRRAHEALMTTLAECGRVPDAEAHLASAIRQFETESVDWLPLRESWRAFRAKQSAPKRSAHAKESLDSADSKIEVKSGVENTSARRVSVAVMPFLEKGGTELQRGGIADGLTEDIITRLAKLRVFFVIARGTVYVLAERNVGPQEAGSILNVDYVVNGAVRKVGQRMVISSELVEVRSGRIQWSDEFDCGGDSAFLALNGIGDRIVAAVAEEIETAERNRAVLMLPNSLDAWEAYHRGLWHMYRFNGADNDQAERFFNQSLRLDPTFARAYAGLSFAHFQNAFLHRLSERPEQTALAFRAAGQSLMADDRDPAAHWAMGRALWLQGQQDESLRELMRSVELSPNFALGHYSIGFVHSQSGDPQIALDSVDHSRNLSPFDPLQFAMLATSALANVRLGNFDEAATWALKAAARPNAHTHILAIAAHCLAVANRVDEARAFAAAIRKNLPNYGFADFLASFHFDKDTVDLFRRGARRIGFD